MEQTSTATGTDEVTEIETGDLVQVVDGDGKRLHTGDRGLEDADRT